VTGKTNSTKPGRPLDQGPAATPTLCEPVAAADPPQCVIVEDQRMFSQLLVTMLRAGPGLDLEIVAAVETVAEGTDAFDALQVVLGRLTGFSPPSPSARDRLAAQFSHREQEVLVLVGQGLQSKQIAERLKISRNTVQSHRKKIAIKLGTEGMELTRYAYHYWQRVAAGGRVDPA
jgi:DNA-binding CsgD family transcriptional regulator